MPIIAWNEDLRVHVAEIDRQHLRLVKMINDLHEGMRAGKSRDILAALIAGMSEYASEHFALEESYFREFGYQEAEPHEQEHARFAARVSEFAAGLEQGRPLHSMEVMSFLTEWLVTHIQGMDKKYIGLFHEQGLR